MTAPNASIIAKHIRKAQQTGELNLNANHLEEVPDLSDVPDVQVLKLSHNQLTEFPESVLGLSELRELDISFNSIVSIPADISDLSNLKVFRCRRSEQDNKSITNFPDELFSLPLEVLDLRNNWQLTYLPDVLKNLSDLRELLLGDCGFDEISDEMCALTNLEVLDLSSNDLTAINPKIGNLKKLKRLDLGTWVDRHNQITELPDEIFGLTALQELSLDENPLTQIPEKIGAFKNLTHLSLRGINAPTPLDQIAKMSRLTVLTLSSTHTTATDELIACLKQLKRLEELEVPFESQEEVNKLKRHLGEVEITW